MSQEIVIDIDQNGGVTIEGKGFEGDDCTKFTREIEQALGEVTRRNFKPEYRKAKNVMKKAGA